MQIIESYTIQYAPAVSQKELEKALHESGDTPTAPPDLHKMTGRIELLGDFEDIKKLRQFLNGLLQKEE